MPDFSWIPEIPEHLWLPNQGGGHHITMAPAALLTPSNVPADMSFDAVLREFDSWKQNQARYYELMPAPGGAMMLMRGPLPSG